MEDSNNSTQSEVTPAIQATPTSEAISKGTPRNNVALLVLIVTLISALIGAVFFTSNNGQLPFLQNQQDQQMQKDEDNTQMIEDDSFSQEDFEEFAKSIDFEKINNISDEEAQAFSQAFEKILTDYLENRISEEEYTKAIEDLYSELGISINQ